MLKLKSVPAGFELYRPREILQNMPDIEHYTDFQVIFHTSNTLAIAAVDTRDGKTFVFKMPSKAAYLPHLDLLSPADQNKMLLDIKSDSESMAFRESHAQARHADIYRIFKDQATDYFAWFYKQINLEEGPILKELSIYQYEYGGPPIFYKFNELAESVRATENQEAQRAPINETIETVHHFFSQLQAVNEKGILLLDIKPDNLLYSEVRKGLFIDVEGAKIRGSVSQRYPISQNYIAATPGYKHPDLIEFEKISEQELTPDLKRKYTHADRAHRYDQFAMAVSMLEVLKKTHPEKAKRPAKILELMKKIGKFKKRTLEDDFIPGSELTQFLSEIQKMKK